MAIKFKMDGAGAMSMNLARVRADLHPKVKQALFVEANIEMTESKKRCPVDVNYAGGRKPPHPGQLRASGTVHPPVVNGNFINVRLTYGGAAVDYAVYVHEIIENHHPVGQAKYLESVLNESRPYMAARLAKRLKL